LEEGGGIIPQKLKSCVSHLEAQGKMKSSAFPICVKSTGLKPHKKKLKEDKTYRVSWADDRGVATFSTKEAMNKFKDNEQNMPLGILKTSGDKVTHDEFMGRKLKEAMSKDIVDKGEPGGGKLSGASRAFMNLRRKIKTSPTVDVATKSFINRHKIPRSPERETFRDSEEGHSAEMSKGNSQFLRREKRRKLREGMLSGASRAFMKTQRQLRSQGPFKGKTGGLRLPLLHKSHQQRDAMPTSPKRDDFRFSDKGFDASTKKLDSRMRRRRHRGTDTNMQERKLREGLSGASRAFKKAEQGLNKARSDRGNSDAMLPIKFGTALNRRDKLKKVVPKNKEREDCRGSSRGEVSRMVKNNARRDRNLRRDG